MANMVDIAYIIAFLQMGRVGLKCILVDARTPFVA